MDKGWIKRDKAAGKRESKAKEDAERRRQETGEARRRWEEKQRRAAEREQKERDIVRGIRREGAEAARRGRKVINKSKHIAAKTGQVSPVPVCTMYLISIAGAEALTAFVDPLWGLIFHFISLFILVVNSAIADSPAARRLFLALGLVPLIRITSLAIPLAEFSQIYWYLIISIPILAGILAVARTAGFKPGEIGLTMHTWPLQILIAFTGVGFGAVEYLILKPGAMVAELTLQDLIVPVLVLMLATGLVEELAFRGVIQRAVQGVTRWGWIYVAALYTALQIGHMSALHCLMALGIALFYGWIVKRTKSIVGVTVSHGLVNVGLYLVYPFVL